MAFEAIRPHQTLIRGLLDEGRTLAQVADELDAQYGVRTTPGTLSRFMTAIRPARSAASKAVPRTASPSPEPMRDTKGVSDATAILTELLSEIDGARTETRDVLEMLSGKVAAASADIVELEKTIAHMSEKLSAHVAAIQVVAPPAPVQSTGVPAGTLTKIWVRATIMGFIAWAALLGFLVLGFRGFHGAG